ncbi:class F sortase [Streptomyces sporangiiformans]|uniref:class F sortase n=1 Tax=Streptomyces sporangiiformans TaxID=2315329 RepID=UPI001F097CFB|nr:class F sortase [Streptomyces sporangiiformans]
MHGFRRPGATVIGPAVLVLATGVWLVQDGIRTELPPRPSAAQALPATADDGRRRATKPSIPGMGASPPIRIRIRAILVDAPVIPLTLDAEGHLEPPPPDDNNLVGWYEGGVAPGQNGTAVMAGHVDNKRGFSVFYGLGSLRPGAEVEIERKDRTTAVFSIDAVEEYPKDRYPSDQVYGETGRPELRLITCGGRFSKKTGYQSNVVAYAHLTRAKSA